MTKYSAFKYLLHVKLFAWPTTAEKKMNFNNDGRSPARVQCSTKIQLHDKSSDKRSETFFFFFFQKNCTQFKWFKTLITVTNDDSHFFFCLWLNHQTKRNMKIITPTQNAWRLLIDEEKKNAPAPYTEKERYFVSSQALWFKTEKKK